MMTARRNRGRGRRAEEGPVGGRNQSIYQAPMYLAEYSICPTLWARVHAPFSLPGWQASLPPSPSPSLTEARARGT